MSTQLSELHLQVERLDYDNKKGIITIDILKEQNLDARNELEELRNLISELKTAQKDASADDKEKRKQEKMAMMMAKFDTVCLFFLVSHLFDLTNSTARCILGEGRAAPTDSFEIRWYRHGWLIIAR